MGEEGGKDLSVKREGEHSAHSQTDSDGPAGAHSGESAFDRMGRSVCRTMEYGGQRTEDTLSEVSGLEIPAKGSGASETRLAGLEPRCCTDTWIGVGRWQGPCEGQWLPGLAAEAHGARASRKQARSHWLRVLSQRIPKGEKKWGRYRVLTGRTHTVGDLEKSPRNDTKEHGPLILLLCTTNNI